MISAFRRWRASRKPFPDHWRDILWADVPFYARLGEEARGRLEDKLKVFAMTKHFEGAGGMAIDDRVRVVVSATAARLTLNLENEHYDRLKELVIYRDAYHHPKSHAIIFGEVNRFGTMVLSWRAVLDGLRNSDSGSNTAYHEFAHALDLQDGVFDGTPVLNDCCAFAQWVSVMTDYFDDLRDGQRRGRILRDYGGKNPAEFFAVATEAFFEQPRQLRDMKPDLYEVLSAYYKSDPAAELEAHLERERQAG